MEQYQTNQDSIDTITDSYKSKDKKPNALVRGGLAALMTVAPILATTGCYDKKDTSKDNQESPLLENQLEKTYARIDAHPGLSTSDKQDIKKGYAEIDLTKLTEQESNYLKMSDEEKISNVKTAYEAWTKEGLIIKENISKVDWMMLIHFKYENDL